MVRLLKLVKLFMLPFENMYREPFGDSIIIYITLSHFDSIKTTHIKDNIDTL